MDHDEPISSEYVETDNNTDTGHKLHTLTKPEQN